MTPAELVAGCELFSALPPAAVSQVAATARPVSLRRNQTVFNEGDGADDLFMVRSGRVAIAKQAADGRESVVALMEQGDVFGEMSLFDGGGRSAGARAIEASELLAVPYPVARAALEEDPRALWAVLALLASRLRTTDDTLAASVFLDVPGRTARRLLELAPGDSFGPVVTQEELAAMVGASRERVNKAIASFVRLGWLEQSERRYRVVDRTKLEGRAR
ncbi:MAG: Crp/Fnr family transcriptional regulator [Acidimicrobiales bacterium]